eukprot:scaffold15108_cov180-Amphora_coffeaeformis.AAC.33
MRSIGLHHRQQYGAVTKPCQESLADQKPTLGRNAPIHHTQMQKQVTGKRQARRATCCLFPYVTASLIHIVTTRSTPIHHTQMQKQVTGKKQARRATCCLFPCVTALAVDSAN